MNRHRNVVFNAQAYRDWIGLTAEDITFGVAPFFHITGLIGNLAAPLFTGMPIVMSYRFDATRVAALVGVIAHRHVDLAGKHDVVALAAGERLADNDLRFAGRVDVGSVDEVDPGVQRPMNDCECSRPDPWYPSRRTSSRRGTRADRNAGASQ
jgi:hypothetical protein